MKCKHCHQNPSANTEKRPAVGNERELIEELLDAMDHPTATISDIAVGSHFIGIRADTNGSECSGLASTLGAAPTLDDEEMVEKMIGSPLCDAASLLKTDSPFSISLGAAALNAGIAPPENQPDFEASRIMADKGKNGETVLVGDFPFTGWLRNQVKTLHLFELQDVPGRTAPERWDEILGRCSVLGLTGTTLITRAMAAYIEKAPQAYSIVIGPTTPLSPVLFSRGIDVLAGCKVVSPDPVFDAIRKGMSFREFKKLGVQFIAWSRPTDAQ